jgi:hypothetical protein
MWDRFWLDPFWHWLDDPKKVKKVRRTSEFVATGCVILQPWHRLVKLAIAAGIYVYDMTQL